MRSVSLNSAMPGKEKTDRLLKRIALQKDKEAFAELFKLYHYDLIQFALMFVKNYQDAEDIVSDVMVKLLDKKESLLEIRDFNKYVFYTIKNQALNFLKKRSYRNHDNISDIPADYLKGTYFQPEQKLLDKELLELITGTVENLPKQRRLIYRLLKNDELKIKEVAQLLDISERTVQKHLELAIRDLRKALETYYSDNDVITPVIRLAKVLALTFMNGSAFSMMF